MSFVKKMYFVYRTSSLTKNCISCKKINKLIYIYYIFWGLRCLFNRIKWSFLVYKFEVIRIIIKLVGFFLMVGSFFTQLAEINLDIFVVLKTCKRQKIRSNSLGSLHATSAWCLSDMVSRKTNLNTILCSVSSPLCSFFSQYSTSISG